MKFIIAFIFSSLLLFLPKKAIAVSMEEQSLSRDASSLAQTPLSLCQEAISQAAYPYNWELPIYTNQMRMVE